MPISILVYGWYNNNNIGDELFKEAFKTLFPQYIFTFTNKITNVLLNGIDAVFFGGGSFLHGAPIIANDCFERLKRLPLFYIGIGVESFVHPIHQELIRLSGVVAVRSDSGLAVAKALNPNAMFVPDIVYSLPVIQTNHTPKKILVLPNVEVLPSWDKEHWRHLAWEYFKTEFAKAADTLLDAGYDINFYLCCDNPQLRDIWAAHEMIAKMSRRNESLVIQNTAPYSSNITALFSKYDLVVTQRYHGIVFAEMASTPYVVIHHHDKLKTSYPDRGKNVPFYGISKDEILSAVQAQSGQPRLRPINNEPYFDKLKDEVARFL